MVSTEDCHSKGRRIESRSFLFLLFVFNPESRRGTRHKKKRKSMNVARNEESGERGSGESKRKDRQVFQEWLRERLSVGFEDN